MEVIFLHIDNQLLHHLLKSIFYSLNFVALSKSSYPYMCQSILDSLLYFIELFVYLCISATHSISVTGGS